MLAAKEAVRKGQERTEADAGGQGKFSEGRRSDRPERRRALIPGEMVNEFRDKINWREYYAKISEAEYNPDYFEDGSIATIKLDGGLAVIEMQRNGEWQVKEYRSYEDERETQESYADEEVSGERDYDGDQRGRVLGNTDRTGSRDAERGGIGEASEGNREARAAVSAEASGDGLKEDGGQRFSRNITGNEAEAARQFGTTEDFREAGYIIGDGRMLRFTNDSNSGTRDYDHRAIAKVYGQSVDFNKNHGFNEEAGPYLDRFVEDGAIRIDTGDFDLGMDMGMQLSRSVPITKAQEDAIRDFVKWKNEQEESYRPDEFSLHNGSLTLRIEFGGDGSYAVGETRKQDLDAWNVPNLQYEGSYISPSRVIADIRHFYETGEIREESTVSKFHDARFSRELKWTPKLSNAEWTLANSVIRNYDGDDFNETKRFALKSAKGNSVFVVYSKSEDSAMLYAIGRDKAQLANEIAERLKAYGEQNVDGIAGRLDRRLKEPEYSDRDIILNNDVSGNSGIAGRTGKMASGQLETQTQRGRGRRENLGDSELRALINALTDSGSYRGRLSRDLPGETAELQDEYDKLKERLSYWKGQVRRTERFTLREADTKRLAKSILSDYSSKTDADSTYQQIKDYFRGRRIRVTNAKNSINDNNYVKAEKRTVLDGGR